MCECACVSVHVCENWRPLSMQKKQSGSQPHPYHMDSFIVQLS